MTLLEKEIRRALDDGYRHFISGMSIGVDMYAARIVLKIKAEQPDLGITLEAAIPFPSQPDKWTETQKSEYAEILALADKRTTVSQKTSKAYTRRNRYMVDNARLVIAVDSYKSGGTQQTMSYAKTKNRELVIINPMEFCAEEKGNKV